MQAKANEIFKNEKKMSINKIWELKSVAGQLSHRPKIFAGQNENLPVLSESSAVFAKTVTVRTGHGILIYFRKPNTKNTNYMSFQNNIWILFSLKMTSLTNC